MNPGTAEDLAARHIRELRRQATRYRTARAWATPSPLASRPSWPRLRRRIGFTLVEAGLNLLTGPEGSRGVTRTTTRPN